MREPYIDVAMRYTSAMKQFFALQSRAEHRAASLALVRMFREHGAKRAKVRLHEGSFDSYFLAPLDVWLVSHRLPNRFRNALGPGDPVARKNLWPSIQLNLALAPGSAKPRARFVRDERGSVWLAHSGTLGGRQTGISREGFLRALGGGARVMIDDALEELVVLGTFARPGPLLEELARITHAAHEYRSALAAGLR